MHCVSDPPVPKLICSWVAFQADIVPDLPGNPQDSEEEMEVTLLSELVDKTRRLTPSLNLFQGLLESELTSLSNHSAEQNEVRLVCNQTSKAKLDIDQL